MGRTVSTPVDWHGPERDLFSVGKNDKSGSQNMQQHWNYFSLFTVKMCDADYIQYFKYDYSIIIFT